MKIPAATAAPTCRFEPGVWSFLSEILVRDGVECRSAWISMYLKVALGCLSISPIKARSRKKFDLQWTRALTPAVDGDTERPLGDVQTNARRPGLRGRRPSGPRQDRPCRPTHAPSLTRRPPVGRKCRASRPGPCGRMLRTRRRAVGPIKPRTHKIDLG